MLTRKGGVVGTLAAVSTLAAFVTSNWVLVLAAIPLVVALAVGGIQNRREAPTLEAEHVVASQRLLAGDSVPAAATVANPGNALGACQLAVDLPEGTMATGGQPLAWAPLPSDRRRSLAYELEAYERGNHALDGLEVRERGPLGLFEREIPVRGTVELEVRPGRDPIEDPPVMEGPQRPVIGPLRTGRPGPGSEFHALREYLPGDPVSIVNWKQTAKHSRPIVDQHEEEAPVDIVLLLDARGSVTLGSGETSTLETSIRAASSIAETALEDRLNVGLGVLTDTVTWLEPATGRGHHERIHKALLDVEPVGMAPLDQMVIPTRSRFPKGAQTYLITPAVHDASVGALVERLANIGVPTSIVSPDRVVAEKPDEVDTDSTRGRITAVSKDLAELERQASLAELEDTPAAYVVDVDPRDPLALSLAEVTRSRR